MTDAFMKWQLDVLASPPEPISQERIVEMFTLSGVHGPVNCWTGTAGGLARMVRELLREREQMLARVQE